MLLPNPFLSSIALIPRPLIKLSDGFLVTASITLPNRDSPYRRPEGGLSWTWVSPNPAVDTSPRRHHTPTDGTPHQDPESRRYFLLWMFPSLSSAVDTATGLPSYPKTFSVSPFFAWKSSSNIILVHSIQRHQPRRVNRPHLKPPTFPMKSRHWPFPSDLIDQVPLSGAVNPVFSRCSFPSVIFFSSPALEELEFVPLK